MHAKVINTSVSITANSASQQCHQLPYESDLDKTQKLSLCTSATQRLNASKVVYLQVWGPPFFHNILAVPCFFYSLIPNILNFPR